MELVVFDDDYSFEDVVNLASDVLVDKHVKVGFSLEHALVCKHNSGTKFPHR